MYEHPTLTDINLIIAKRLKERREMLGMSHQELSKSANINVKQVQKYENATIPIAGSALYFLARELKVPLKYFIDIPHIKPPNEYFFTTEDDYKFFEHIIAEDSEEYIAPPKADCQFIADSPVACKEPETHPPSSQLDPVNVKEDLGLDSVPQLTAEIEEVMKAEMCHAVRQEVLALVKVFIEVPNPIIRQKIIELLRAITTIPLDPD